MQVILPAPRVPCPRRTAEDRLPVRGRRAVGLGIGPDIPVGLGVIAAGAAFAKPVMLVRSVRIDLVDQYLEAEFMGPGDDCVEVFQRAEDRVDIAIIRYVVAEILHRRFEERRDPDRIRAKFGDVRQALRDTRQVADAIAIRIHEAARIDLVDHRTLPPRQLATHSAVSATRQTAHPNAGSEKAALPGAVTPAGQTPASCSNERAS